jgi:hypothetical protein
MRVKFCRKCKTLKPVGQFGLRIPSRCIECVREANRIAARKHRKRPAVLTKMISIEARRMPDDEIHHFEPRRFKLVAGEVIDTWRKVETDG